MKVWTITYNDDNGLPSCAVFNSEEGVEDAAHEWIEGYRKEYPEVNFDQPWRDVFETLWEHYDFMDSITIQKHDIQPPETTGLDEIIAGAVRTDDDTEVDDNAIVAMGEDPGAFVSSWTWVRFSEIEQTMAIIEEDGTVWYFDCFDQFMEAWCEEPNCHWVKGTHELLEKSEGANDAWEYLTRKDRRAG